MKQAVHHRLRRLLRGLCPIHGACMGPIGDTYENGVILVKCSRNDCGIRGWQLDEGPVFLCDEKDEILPTTWAKMVADRLRKD
jgi:hypothetical protein